MPVRVRASWCIPGEELPERADGLFEAEHVPAVQALEGVSRHGLLRYQQTPSTVPPRWWRGEDIHFADRGQFERVTSGDAWKALWRGEFAGAVTGLRLLAFDVLEEFEPSRVSISAGGSWRGAGLSGIWQVPARRLPEDIDPVYEDTHVPNTRRLPRLRRHTVLRAIDWPYGRHSTAWRSAEIRFDSRESLDAAYHSPEYDRVKTDGFVDSVAGPEVDVYEFEELCLSS